MAKQYPAKLNIKVVLELLQGDKTPGQVTNAYDIHPITAGKWRQQFLEKGAEVFNQDGVVAYYERRIGELKQLLGKREVKIAFLKNFLGPKSLRRSRR